MDSLSISGESLYSKKRAKEEDDRVARILRPYATFLVKYPSVVLVVTILVVVLSAVLAVIPATGAKDLPDFSNPSKGFEARGTDLSARYRTYENTEREYDKGNLNSDIQSAINKSSSRRRRNLDNTKLSYDYLQQFSRKGDGMIFVYKQENDQNLMQLSHMKSLCKIYQEKIMTTPSYNIYITEDPHHLPNYIAIYNNRTSCNDITKEDVDRFVHILKQCLPYYKNNKLTECLTLNEADCRNHINNAICTQSIGSSRQHLHVMLYNTFHYLTDKGFVVDANNLKMTTSLTPFFSYPIDMIKQLHKSTLEDLSDTLINGVQIVAYDLVNLKFELFQKEIILQSLLIITAIVLVVVFIWIYSSSLFVGLMTLLCIIFALIISMFVYGRIFNIDFFPFLNMVALIFIVGIGADDAFVYTGIWEEAKHVYVIDDRENHIQYLVKWTTHAIRHAVVAMLVTSLTTAAAFYANVSSSITSVKCFGLYAGTSIIVNYLLMITLFPVVVILHDKYFARCMHTCCPGICKTRPTLKNDQESSVKSPVMTLMAHITYYADLFFSKHLPKVLLKLRYLWIVLFVGLGVGGAIVTFWKPGLSLPTSQDFQMFTSSNSIEQYALKYKKEFFFTQKGDSVRPIYIIFGVKPEDNGYHFDPDDSGKLRYNSDRVRVENEQQWLLTFCKNVKNESFYISSEICDNIESFYAELKSPCAGINNRPGCCNQSIPIKPEKNFLKCFYEDIDKRGTSRNKILLFDTEYNLRVLVITLMTNYKSTQENSYNEKMFDELNNWFDKEKATLTETSMAGGWWHAKNFNFYDLQVALFKGTKESVAIAIAVAFAVILFTTLNILLSLYSILTIFFVISVTIGVLVLAGWELNIMESVVFSVAAGLSADFTLHYSVAYRTSLIINDRVERTKSSLEHIGAAILMGAFTTFIAGLVMVPAKVLVYYQMAQFLMLVMVVSWFYSTFFFLPLCMAIGPTKNFGQLTCKKIKVAKETVRKMSTKKRPGHPVPLGNVNPENIHTDMSIHSMHDDYAAYNNKTN